MVDFDADRSIDAANRRADMEDKVAGVRCPFCGGAEIHVGQYTWNWQPYNGAADDWGLSEYSYDDEHLIGARCANYDCEADLTDFMLRQGWRFYHDLVLENRSHQVEPLPESDQELTNEIEAGKTRLSRLLDEQARRKAAAQEGRPLKWEG